MVLQESAPVDEPVWEDVVEVSTSVPPPELCALDVVGRGDERGPERPDARALSSARECPGT